MTRASTSRSKQGNNRSGRRLPPKLGCGVCGNDDGKYKCPKCRVPYCSVNCCKEHKKKCSAAQNEKNSTIVAHSNSSPDGKMSAPSQYLPSDALTADPLQNSIRRRRMLEDDNSDCEEEGFRISSDMMSRLNNSAWLKKELSDGGLRQMICEIDSADNDVASENRPGQHRNGKRRKMNISPREIALEKSKILNPKFAGFVDRLLLTAGVLVTGHLIGLQPDEEETEHLMLAPLQKKVNNITPLKDD
eukprot:CAMPEP_0198250540 /NCGR_PEP_ID=MMETSP1447-20131203/1690_1 /TAXON_ID=420782 /ORGANISM="Chaetoceros dichaeta, Strain CCMP1751" /LENGTH=245 /DNA_ID=CAMNT_0043935387 /DNA_START=24 /DNA_END=761 /DNA_ORIENTATION=+